MKSLFQFFSKKKQTITPEEFAEIKRAHLNKKKDLEQKIKAAQGDLTLKDILIKELAQAENNYQKISEELWGHIPPHGQSLKKQVQKQNSTDSTNSK